MKTDSLHFEQGTLLDWRFLNFPENNVIKIIAYFKKDIVDTVAPFPETPKSVILQFCHAQAVNYYKFVYSAGFLVAGFYRSK